MSRCCKEGTDLFIQSGRATGTGGPGGSHTSSEMVTVCNGCGMITVAGSINGERYYVSFYLRSEEQLLAAYRARERMLEVEPRGRSILASAYGAWTMKEKLAREHPLGMRNIEDITAEELDAVARRVAGQITEMEKDERRGPR